MLVATRIESALDEAALTYLARAPYENVFLSYLLLCDLSVTTRNAFYVVRNADNAIEGVGFFGRQIVIAAEPHAVRAFVPIGRAHRGMRMIVGKRETVIAYWNACQPSSRVPRIVRDRQHVMAIDASMLAPPTRTDIVVRKARMDEWTTVADNSAAMIAHELDFDPMRESSEFTSNIRTMIERGLWWVGESYGRLGFFCNIGPWTPQTAQLQGIWTPPELRGKGLATAALRAICARLFEQVPTSSLYVNDFNAPAIELYERVGFKRVGEFQTLLF